MWSGSVISHGWYHLFYQYNPHSAIWGNITWGHAVSKDLINWFHLPRAMVPDHWYDLKGVMTGSATVLPDGRIMMYYTGKCTRSLSASMWLRTPLIRPTPFLLNGSSTNITLFSLLLCESVSKTSENRQLSGSGQTGSIEWLWGQSMTITLGVP
ncbi:putative sucrose:sucrose fructosyltransferase [Helianthus annuus]|nr:putative sucrose:sucrose fructosyltransferase [Helianthus annuus]